MSDAQATELAVGNPDAAMVVPIRQPSIDYTVPQGNSVTQDAPNKLNFDSSVVADRMKETASKTNSNDAVSSSASTLAVEQPSQPDSSKIGRGSVVPEAIRKALDETRSTRFLQTKEAETARMARKPIACSPA